MCAQPAFGLAQACSASSPSRTGQSPDWVNFVSNSGAFSRFGLTLPLGPADAHCVSNTRPRKRVREARNGELPNPAALRQAPGKRRALDRSRTGLAGRFRGRHLARRRRPARRDSARQARRAGGPLRAVLPDPGARVAAARRVASQEAGAGRYGDGPIVGLQAVDPGRLGQPRHGRWIAVDSTCKRCFADHLVRTGDRRLQEPRGRAVPDRRAAARAARVELAAGRRRPAPTGRGGRERRLPARPPLDGNLDRVGLDPGHEGRGRHTGRPPVVASPVGGAMAAAAPPRGRESSDPVRRGPGDHVPELLDLRKLGHPEHDPAPDADRGRPERRHARPAHVP